MVKVPGEGSSLSAALECRDSLAFRVQRFAGVTLLQKKTHVIVGGSSLVQHRHYCYNRHRTPSTHQDATTDAPDPRIS